MKKKTIIAVGFFLIILQLISYYGRYLTYDAANSTHYNSNRNFSIPNILAEFIGENFFIILGIVVLISAFRTKKEKKTIQINSFPFSPWLCLHEPFALIKVQ